MTLSRFLFAVFAVLCSTATVELLVAQEPAPPLQKRAVTPWGISSSASSFRNHEDWFPKMKEAGISTIRLFPEWRGFEPKQGTWHWADGDRLVKSAVANGLEINAILMGSPPGNRAVHAFPMDNLDDWSKYVTAVVGRYKNQIRYWEVWNEGNGGFNDGKHTTTDYARLAAATYEAAKNADPQSKVGLTVASFDAPYLHKAIRAMSAADKPNSFDFLCIHPYEIADGLADTDGEIPFLWMCRTLRSMLEDAAPQRADAEIWMTEVGHRVSSREGRAVTDKDAAGSLAKMYTMAIAQGITCTQWFEAQDPVGEDHGFGLLSRDGSPRAAYQTLKTLSGLLGAMPKYQGWLALGPEKRGYGFAFAGESAAVLIAWVPVEHRSNSQWRTLTLSRDVQVTDLLNAKTRTVLAGQSLVLSDAPVAIAGLPSKLIEEAQANAKLDFPWGGDYSSSKSISFQAGLPDQLQGVFARGRSSYPTVTFSDGSSGLVVAGDINHPISFYTHPSFASFQTKDYYVRVTVRRLAAGNVGMNLRYEVADSQGRSPYANVGQWFGVSQDSTWQTYTWHCKNACFAKMWGYDFVISPEQSIPFAIGKVEVSTVPFE
jgi:hypothetical protein